MIEESEDDGTEIPAALPVDEDGNVIIPSGRVLRAIPVEEQQEEDGEPVDSLEQALPAIPVDDAPVAIPVQEDD